MTIKELESDVRRASWFSKLGEFRGAPGMRGIKNLNAWSDESAEGDADVADGMEWLPTTADTQDPIHGQSVSERLNAQGDAAEAARIAREMYKMTLVSLRHAPRHPLLVVGRHDFTKAARGAALYAVHRAAMEMVADMPQPFWSLLVPLYRDGFWPCGIMPDGDIVVL